MFKKIFSLILPIFFTALPAHAAGLIDFNSLANGEIVTTQFFASEGVTISASNPNRAHDLAITFNTTLSPTADPDLQDPWDAGNLSNPQEVLNNILILAENNTGAGDGFVDTPDDEGNRPAGSIFFDFLKPITSFGFDLVDVEGDVEYDDDSGYAATFYNGATELGRVGFGQFVNPADLLFYDASVVYGDNSANRIQPITAAQLGGTSFDRVEINFGGSAGIDNVNYSTVPEPMTMSLFGAGLAGLAFRPRRKKK